MTTLLSAAKVAEKLGCDKSTVTRRAKKIKAGTLIGTSLGFTQAEIDRLSKIIQPGPGCPKFKPGNKLWKRRKNNRKSRK